MAPRTPGDGLLRYVTEVLHTVDDVLECAAGGQVVSAEIEDCRGMGGFMMAPQLCAACRHLFTRPCPCQALPVSNGPFGRLPVSILHAVGEPH